MRLSVLAPAALALVVADWSTGDIGIDNMNDDILSFNMSTNSTAECFNACLAQSGCMGWVVSPSGSCGSRPFCWLKNSFTAITLNPCRISGIVPSSVLPAAFTGIPVGSVKPAGWMATELQLQADGLSGSLAHFWADIQTSVWIGGSADSGLHERTPYWLNGLAPLAFLTGDVNVTAQMHQYINYILGAQTSSGWFGPDDAPTDGNEYWARFNVLQTLVQYWEGSQDARVMPAVFAYLMEARTRMLAGPQLAGWAAVRAQDFILVLHYLIDNYDKVAPQLPAGSTTYYNRAFLYDLATLTHTQMLANGADWKSWYDLPTFPTGVTCAPEPCSLLTHGVNNGQAIKSEAVWYRQSQDATDIASTYIRISKLDKYHGAPSGVFQADEHLAGTMPSHGTELCAVVEAMYSYEVAGQIIGDAAFFERAEEIAYNALPATMTKDMWAHQYLQQANEISAAHTDPHVWVTDGPDSTIFGLQPNYGCCTANMHQGWPKFAQRMIQATTNGAGIAVAMWGPIAANVSLNGTTVNVGVDTQYPFGDSAVVTVNSPLSLTAQLRIPSWATAATYSINGQASSPVPASAVGYFLSIQLPAGSSSVTLQFNPTIRVQSWPDVANGTAIVVRRGALLYGLQLAENFTTLAHYYEGSNDYQIVPENAWNYALVIADPNAPASSFQFVQAGAPGAEPYSTTDVPVKVQATGRLVNAWSVQTGAAAPPPVSPVCENAGDCGAATSITLVPFGSTHLRISVFPYTTA